MTYADQWQWWLEDACYRVARGTSLMTSPCSVGRDVWHEIMLERARLEKYHGVHIWIGEWITDDFGEAAEVMVGRYSWVRDLSEAGDGLLNDECRHALAGLLYGYSGEAINEFVSRIVSPIEPPDVHVKP